MGKRKLMAGALAMIMMLAGCGNNGLRVTHDNSQDDTELLTEVTTDTEAETEADTEEDTEEITEAESASTEASEYEIDGLYNDPNEAYLAVLNGESDFFMMPNDTGYGPEQKTQMNIKKMDIEGTSLNVNQPTSISFIDAENDGLLEPVVAVNVTDSTGQSMIDEYGYVILHYFQGRVYGYFHIYRGLEALTEFGSFWASGGATDGTEFAISFQDEQEVLTVTGEESWDEENQKIIYKIGGEEVDEDFFWNSMADGAEKVEFHDFSDTDYWTQELSK